MAEQAGIPDRVAISSAVRAVLAEYVPDQAADVLEINDGLCEEFAASVIDRLGGDRPDLCEMDVSSFCRGGMMDAVLDRSMAESLFPGCSPPPCLSWEDLDELGVPDFAHMWVFAGGRSYDADAPDGVDSPFDLPLFRRNLALAVRQYRPEAAAGLGEDPWWAESFRLHDELVAWRSGEPEQDGASLPVVVAPR